jgi:hypothetical protein
MQDDVRELRVPPELLARWALETPQAAQVATYRALAFLARTEHAACTLLPVADALLEDEAALDSDGFLRQPRGALSHFRQRTERATAWLEMLVSFRERFPRASEEPPPPPLFQLAAAFSQHADALESATDLLLRECVMPELEEALLRAITYPGLQALLLRLRETDTQRSADACKLAAAAVGPLSGRTVWLVRRRLVTGAGRAVLGARPLFDELQRAGLPVDRRRAAKGFARRLEEAVAVLPGKRVLPAALVARLAGALHGEEAPLRTDEQDEAGHPGQ